LDEFLTRLGAGLKAPLRCVSGSHADNNPSMYRHNEKWWHCFSCGGNFNIYHFAAHRLDVNLDKGRFREISEFIEDTLGLPRSKCKPDAFEAAMKSYMEAYGEDGFLVKSDLKGEGGSAVEGDRTNFADKLLRDLDNSQVGVIANSIMEKFKGVPLAGDPKSEAVFSDYFCHNLYPHIIFTNEFGFYIYNYDAGVFQTDLAEAAIFFLIRRIAKRIEGFDISTSKKFSGILKFVSMHPLVHKTEKEFDRDDFLLNAKGAVYNLKTLESEPATPETPMKMSASVRPKSAETPVFDGFLSQISNGDPAMEAYLLRFMGYALAGSTREQIFLDFFGGGKNGKTTFIELMLYILGSYATTVSPDLIIDKNAPSKSECAAADLQNKRLATLADCNYGTLNDSMIKRITGGDTVRARHLYRDSFEFTPKCKLIIGTNKKLRLRDTGESVKRRLRLVPFEFHVPKKDRTLPEKLRGEAEGILFKLIREAYDYLCAGELPACDRIDKASQKYIDEENPFAAFFKERLKFDPAFSVKTVDVWEAYKAWTEANDAPARKKRELVQELELFNCKVSLTRQSPVVQGVRIVQ
jgi:P4 family phage/plasmid primase-like protien